MCITSIIHIEGRAEMNVLRNIEARDWVIGVVAFLAGAWIF
jgi:hypothetical protein